MTIGKSSDLPYWVAFTRFNKFGAVSLVNIARTLPSMTDAWRATPRELSMAGIKLSIAQEFVNLRNKINPEKEWDNVQSLGIEVITIFDNQYPTLLKQIHDPPAILFVRGKLKNNTPNPLGVVGTRKMTTYGARSVEYIVKPLVRNGISIVSGLALGIDGKSHEAALSQNGYTVAVLGSGVDDNSIYPNHHKKLAHRIIESNGAVISEFPPGTKPLAHHFPMRNRIISGLSKGILVIEAAIKSGSLISARCALDQNRDVYAIPGQIFSPTSAGTNQLIAHGAKVVTSANDILEDFEKTIEYSTKSSTNTISS